MKERVILDDAESCRQASEREEAFKDKGGRRADTEEEVRERDMVQIGGWTELVEEEYGGS